MAFPTELETQLDEAFQLTMEGKTVLFMFEDMYEVNERFQALLDWFKEKGNKMRRRFGQGAYMQHGMVYFVGADTHTRFKNGEEVVIPTRGVTKEYDLRQYAPFIVRQTGLNAKLRERMKAAGQCCGIKDQGGEMCSDCPAAKAA